MSLEGQISDKKSLSLRQDSRLHGDCLLLCKIGRNNRTLRIPILRNQSRYLATIGYLRFLTAQIIQNP